MIHSKLEHTANTKHLHTVLLHTASAYGHTDTQKVSNREVFYAQPTFTHKTCIRNKLSHRPRFYTQSTYTLCSYTRQAFIHTDTDKKLHKHFLHMHNIFLQAAKNHIKHLLHTATFPTKTHSAMYVKIMKTISWALLQLHGTLHGKPLKTSGQKLPFFFI